MIIWITDKRASIFDSRAQVLVNPVNCDGIMGAGLALEFKNRYPLMFADYRVKCVRGEINIGSVYLWRNTTLMSQTSSQAPKRKSILLFPTKNHWRSPSHLLYIRKGLEHFVRSYNLGAFAGLRSIAFPLLGCGLGRLNRVEVKELMREHLEPLEGLNVEIYLR